MNYKKLTVKELKNICKKNGIKGYSLLNKEDLIKHIKKNLKRKMKGGLRITNNGKKEFILDRSKLLEILKIDEKSLKEIKAIDLSDEKIQITEIEKNTFKGLINLTNLNLSNNLIENIDHNTFDDLVKLNELNLSNNCIIRLEDNTFKNLDILTELNLSNNSIDGLSKSEFTGLKNLKILDLSNNSIKDIQNDVFTHLQNVENINLSSNKIRNIHYFAFNNLNKLNYLNLSNNLVSDIYKDLRKYLKVHTVCYTEYEYDEEILWSGTIKHYHKNSGKNICST
jgi:Leucine-rich repeat (LRR) protein